MTGDRKAQSVILTEEAVNEIFDTSEDQTEAFNKLYSLVVPDIDQCKEIRPWPKAGSEVSDYIFKKFIEFDRIHHPEVFSGGLWLNCGFSSEKNMHPWTIDATGCFVQWKEG